MRIGFFDIETTDLSADKGRILCACVKPLGSDKVFTVREDQFGGKKKSPAWDDTKVVAALLDELRTYDLLVTYYGRFFDVPFLRSRAFTLGKRPPISFFHLDLHLIAKNFLKLTSNRLARVSEFMELEESKTPLNLKTWMKAADGDTAALNYICKHCVQDVKVLEDLYEQVLHYVKSLTRVTL